MNHLLHITNMVIKQDRGAPIILEVPVDPEGEPWLVSSVRPYVYQWLSHRVLRAHGPNHLIRMCVQEFETPFEIELAYKAILASVVHASQTYKWGNFLKGWSKAALAASVSYLHSYGLKELELLIPTGLAGEACFQSLPKNVALKEASWLTDQFVVLPTDREFVGFLAHLGDEEKYTCALIHNASRGLVICQK